MYVIACTYCVVFTSYPRRLYSRWRG